MSWIVWFVFGLLIGSFINVLSLRYKEGERILVTRAITGRSHCMTCRKTLRWYELVPLFSFLAQAGKCRGCKTRLSWQYPAIELASGLLTAFLTTSLYQYYSSAQLLSGNTHLLLWVYIATGLWLIVGYTCLTLAAIDLRLQIIPDQSNVLIGIVGIILCAFYATGLVAYQPFTGPYATMLGLPNSPIISSLLGAGFGLVFFGGIVFLTRGRGMGLGDVKLAIPMGILLGWPDALIAFASAFIIGTVVSLAMLLKRKATMKAMIPFGPFLVIGLFVAVFFGEKILQWYFGLI